MRRKTSPALAAEPLERRHLLAVTAFVDTLSGDLQIQLGEDGDQATLTAVDLAPSTAPPYLVYQITGTGLASPLIFGFTNVAAISVSGGTGAQHFTVASAGNLAVGNPLKVDEAVETTAVYGRIDSSGIVLVESAETVLGNSVRSAGEQSYLGQVLLDGDVVVDAGTAPVRFLATIDGIGNGRFQHGASGNLEIRTAAETFFGGPVGGRLGLAGLTTEAVGTTTLSGGRLTAGSAEFRNPVNLAAPTTLSVAKVRFGGTVDGAYPLAIAGGTGDVDFVGIVGGVNALAGLAITNAGKVTAAAAIMLDGTATNAASDGLTIGSAVDVVTLASGGSISGFRNSGIVYGGTAPGSRISGFDIRDNGGDGILVQGSHLLVGGKGQAGNVIRGNLRSGVTVRGPTAIGNQILGNSIFLNGSGPPPTAAAGIRLQNGGNADQATPTIEAVGIDMVAGVARVRLSIPTANSRTFQVELFSNTQIDAGDTTPVDPTVLQGRMLVGTGTVVGSGPVILEIPLAAAAVGDWLTATATAVDGSTSPFSAAAQVAASITVAVAVTPPAVGRYRVGDVLTFAVDFAVPVFVTGVPALPFTIGAASLQAAYAGGSGTTSLLFRHTVQPGEVGGVLIGSLFAFAGGGIRDDLGVDISNEVPYTNTEGIVVDDTAGVVFAAANAGSSVAWDREFVYSVVNATTIRVAGLPAAQAGFFPARMPLTITPAGAAESQTATVVRSSYNARQRTVTVTLSGAIPTPRGGGTLVLGSATAPGARLVEAGTGSQQREFSAADLAQAGYSNAFVTRFQGGLRAVAADVNGNGRADLVVAPGGVPDRPDPAAPNQRLSRVFGTSLSTVAIFDGAVRPAWSPVAIDVASVFIGGARDGYFVALGDCVDDAPGSGVMELVVAAGGRVAVFDLLVSAQGARPEINPVPVRVTDLPSGQAITSLTVGRLFATNGHDDVVIAATTASQRAAGTTRVTILAGSTGETTRSFVVSSFVESGPARRFVDIFGFGASVGVGDIDGDQRADIVLGAGANGLANFRVLGNEFVTAESAITNPASFAASIAEQLGPRGQFAQAPRQGRGWRPTGGPDFFTPSEVIGPTGMGFNAPLSVVVVNGLPAANGRAQIFAALGGSNQTANTVRRFLFNGPNAWTADASIDLLPSTPGNPRFRYGGGVRLG